MGARLRSGWQKIKQHRVAIAVVAIVFAVVIVLIIAGYWFDWQNQLETLARDRAKEQDLRTAFLDKKKQAVNLEAYRKQLA